MTVVLEYHLPVIRQGLIQESSVALVRKAHPGPLILGRRHGQTQPESGPLVEGLEIEVMRSLFSNKSV